MAERARVWEEVVTIPTYKVYPPEKNPLFIEKRAYQGSTGKVYPLPVTEKISDEREDVAYRAVFLENEYLKVMLLPELGGRIQRATDKTNGYDFVYYNRVIKPALVGLAGPWISGGIEFNWPQHHRPTTFMPTDCVLRENPDGSCTAVMGEIDRMYGTKGTASITLYPGKAFIEVSGRLYNPTDLPQTFLWWANPAVPVNDHTYSVFPPDVRAVFDHGKRAVSTFPIATGEYYKCDYSAGVDISRYRNVPVPTSYMAAHSDYDFIGNYDEQRQAGLLHVADHHISPGKKQWTWGNGDFGRAWDRNLTDADGPYIELMTGVFTDNQPDFTWLKPHEEKTFTQYFMPYRGVGRVCNATRDAALGLSGEDDCGVLRAWASAPRKARLTVTRNGEALLDAEAELAPDRPFEGRFDAPGGLDGCEATVTAQGRILVRYRVFEPELAPVPEPAERMLPPEALKTTEDLYLSATHLEQYRHATYEPADYYLEGLRRDPADIRLNNGYGLLMYRRGRFAEALPFFETAVRRQAWRNPNPYSGECWFNLGLALEALGRPDEAFDAFYKSTWSAETQNPGFYRLACATARRAEWADALAFVDNALVRNGHDMRARTLKAALLRKLGRDNTGVVDETLAIDPLCMGCLYERSLKTGDLAPWKGAMGAPTHDCLELCLEYLAAGLYGDALAVLRTCEGGSPMPDYYEGYTLGLLGDTTGARAAFRRAEAACPDGCFPNRLEEIAILQSAVDALSAAPMAHYYLGCLLYDKKRYAEAAAHWQACIHEKPDFAAAHRNLAIYAYNKQGDAAEAMALMDRACTLDGNYPRLWLERDQLAARMNLPVADRLAAMETRMDVVSQRDDLFLRYVTLLNCAGRHREALEGLAARRFHPWEGGEGKASGQYVLALTRLAVEALDAGRAAEALAHLERALSYPENLGEGKLPNVPDHCIHYHIGMAQRMLGDEAAARRALALAAAGPQEPQPVLYYNDQPSDFIFYQGLASRALGQETDALRAFHRLIAYGEKHRFDEVSYDYFAVSLPEIEVFQEDIRLRNVQYCDYLRALGTLGIGNKAGAAELFRAVLGRAGDHQGALAHLGMAET